MEMRDKEKMNDVEFFDVTTYTLGGVQTVHRYYDDLPNLKWGGKDGFVRTLPEHTHWKSDNILDKIFVKLAKSEKN